MTKLAALVSGFGWHVADLERAAKRVGLSLQAAPFASVCAAVGRDRKWLARHPAIAAGRLDLTAVDGVLVRMMPPGSLEQVVFRMDVLHRLRALGISVLNPPRAVEAAVDKYLALGLLDGAGVPVPETWTGESAADALAVFDTMGQDVVVKPLFGSEGRGLVRITDKEIAWRAFRAVERMNAVLYLQRTIANPGHDFRVFVLDGAILGSMRRHATGGEWRTNIARGGRAEPCRLEPVVERLALDAARALGARMAGVDVIYDLEREQFVVLEVNAVPGWRALSRVTGIDVAAAILTALRDTPRPG